MAEEKKLSKTKLIVVGIAAIAVAAAMYFKVDLGKAIDDFTKTQTAVEKVILE